MSNNHTILYNVLLEQQRFYEERIALYDRLLAHAEDNGLREEGQSYFQERLRDCSAVLDDIRLKIERFK